MSTRRPSVLVVTTVRHPRLPFGLLCLPCLSFVLYLLAWSASIPVRSLLLKREPPSLPVPPERLAALLPGLVGIVLRSGSYTLLEIAAPGGLRVHVRLI